MSEQEKREGQQINPNSALYWLGAAEEVASEYDDLHFPETEVVEFDFMEALPLLEGRTPDNFPYGELDSAACDLGWPVFLRTDLTSAKHEGLDGIQAVDADDVQEVAADLVQECAMKTMRPGAFLVREWIDVDHEFRAFGDLPIGVEFRVFATPDEHLCTHYYWPEDSIVRTSEHESIWRNRRDELEYARKPPWLGAAARGAAFEADFQHGIDEPERAWSVDFARDEDGDWWIIDMALAKDSWRPDDCDLGKDVISA